MSTKDERRACVACLTGAIDDHFVTQHTEECMGGGCTKKPVVVIALLVEGHLDVTSLCAEHYEPFLAGLSGELEHAAMCPKAGQ